MEIAGILGKAPVEGLTGTEETREKTETTEKEKKPIPEFRCGLCYPFRLSRL